MMFQLFSDSILQHLAYLLLTLSLIFALRASIVTYTIGKKTNKKLSVLRISIGTYILGLISTVLLWIGVIISAEINKNEMADLKIKLYLADSSKNAFSMKLDSTENKLDSTKIKLDSTSSKLDKVLATQKPRHLTENQKKKFLEYVSNCENLQVGIKCVTNNQEAWNYANEFLDLLKQTNFNTFRKVLPVQYFGKPKTGIYLIINDDSGIPVHTLLVQNALKHINIVAPAQKEKNIEPDYVFILIGNK